MIDALARHLQERGLLDSSVVTWAATHASRHQLTFDTALLDLDLLDEEELIDALEVCSGLPATSWRELASPGAGIGEHLPEGFSRTFRMCPWRLDGSLLTALVEAPLPADWLSELRELFGLEVAQHIAPAHYLSLGRERVYGTPAPASAKALEERLARRRAADVRAVLERVGGARHVRAAAEAVLDFTGALLEHAGFLSIVDDRLQLVARRGYLSESEPLAMPEPGATLGAALRHRGFFAGPIAGTEADRRFWARLGCEAPNEAMVVPVPARDAQAVVFLADNGPRGISTRRVAELTLLVSRLGARRGRWTGPVDELGPDSAPPDAEAATARGRPSTEPPELPAEDGTASAVLHPGEGEALERLRRVAEAEGVDVASLVDTLLTAGAARRPAPEEPNTALLGEVRGLFERLAHDIPAQLARGMETAFKDMAPRIASRAPGPPEPAPTPSAAASVGLVRKEPTEREVPTYRSRRARAKRVKL